MNRIEIECRSGLFIAFWRIRDELVCFGTKTIENLDRLIRVGDTKDDITREVEDFMKTNQVPGGYVFLPK